MTAHCVQNHSDVADDEDEKDRHQECHGFPDPSQVQEQEQKQRQAGRKELRARPVRRKKRVDGVASGSNGHGDRDRRHDNEQQRQVSVRSERPIGFVGTAGGRGQPVGAQTDPRQKRRQGNLMEDVRVANIAGLADEELL